MQKAVSVPKIAFIALLLAILWPIFATNSCNNYRKYDDFKIYDVFLENERQYHILMDTFFQCIDVLNRGNLQPMRILLATQVELKLLEFLVMQNVKFRKITDNVAASACAASVKRRSIQSASNATIHFASYHRFDVIHTYLLSLGSKYPTHVEVMNLGKSYEGRDLIALLITASRNETSTDQPKPLVLIDAGIHAREWISHATALYVIQQLVENSTFYSEELEMFDWLVWPVVNPDGYEYSHVKDRFWRKTRKPSGTGSRCLGTDINRNFDFYWSYDSSSYNPCDEDYHGPMPFSEPESRALRDLLYHVNSSCLMYLTLHSYGNYLLYPWGYKDALPPTWPYLDAVARAGAKAIQSATGTSYTVGGSTRVLYAAAGASDDFAFAKANIPIALCMELPSGGNDFDPPVHQILPIVSETWLGIRTMALEAYSNPLRNVGVTTVVLSNLVLIVIIKFWTLLNI